MEDLECLIKKLHQRLEERFKSIQRYVDASPYPLYEKCLMVREMVDNDPYIKTLNNHILNVRSLITSTVYIENDDHYKKKENE